MSKITPAQARVALMVGQGLSNQQVARTLQLAESTVKNHLNAIYANSGVVNRNELIQACQRGTLGVDPPRSRP